MSIEHHIGKKKQWYYALLRNDVKTCDKFYNNKLTSRQVLQQQTHITFFMT